MQVNWKIFWRIIFDVVHGNPRLQLEMTLWDLFPFNRRGRIVRDLTPDIKPDGIVHFVGDKAVFFGGYLECEVDLDSAANSLLDQALADTGDPRYDVADPNVLQAASESINGENVSIDAEVLLYDTGSGSEFPIFYFPQPDAANGVRLIERSSPDRAIHWEISNQVYDPLPSFSLETFDGHHRLRVRQAAGLEERDEFIFLVDSIPIPWGLSLTDRTHLFSGKPQCFYIGATPDHLGGLFGEIKRLDFDPNSSCPSCAGNMG